MRDGGWKRKNAVVGQALRLLCGATSASGALALQLSSGGHAVIPSGARKLTIGASATLRTLCDPKPSGRSLVSLEMTAVTFMRVLPLPFLPTQVFARGAIFRRR